MHQFVIDVNLPIGIPPFDSESCLHIVDMDKRMPDSQVWDFAKKHGATIVTKDADFANRILVSEPPPKAGLFHSP